MKKRLIAVAAIAIAVSGIGFAAHSYKSQSQKLGYTIGYDMGQSFHKQDVKINFDAVSDGFNAGYTGKKPELTKAQMKSAIEKYRDVMIAKMQAEQKKAQAKVAAQAKPNLDKSAAFMKKIAGEKGVHKINDGVYYKVLKAGTGPKPKLTDEVTVNYAGKLISGKVFDSSYKRGKPTSFKLNQVIHGWSAALTQMPQGSTWDIYIAPDEAYGNNAPPSIGPGQALIFKVDLIAINGKK